VARATSLSRQIFWNSIPSTDIGIAAAENKERILVTHLNGCDHVQISASLGAIVPPRNAAWLSKWCVNLVCEKLMFIAHLFYSGFTPAQAKAGFTGFTLCSLWIGFSHTCARTQLTGEQSVCAPPRRN
jgi:hypothetical protein